MNKFKTVFLISLFNLLFFAHPSFAVPLEVQNYNKNIGKKMVSAIKEGKLIVPEYIRIYISELAKYGFCNFESNSLIVGTSLSKPKSEIVKINRKAYLSKPLLKLLDSLISSKTVSKSRPISILSLFRSGSTNHAKLENNEVICRSVDIDYYSGFRINIINPTSSLEAIVQIINNMPEGIYNMGLPRPGGGKLIDPKTDFFLPVKKLEQNQVSPTGTISGDLKLIKSEKARVKMTEAVKKNKKAQILYLMPDATDHVHIKAIDPGKLQ